MPDEIETEEIIKDIFRQGKTCFIPRYQLQSNHMDMVKLASPEEIASLPRTSWNIQQPGEDAVLEEALSTGEHYNVRTATLGCCPAALAVRPLICLSWSSWEGHFFYRDECAFHLCSKPPT